MDGKFHAPDTLPADAQQAKGTDSSNAPADHFTRKLSREEMVQICARVMRNRREGRFAEIAAVFTHDAEMFCPGIPGHIPVAGRFKGRDECIAAMRANFTLIEAVDLVPQEFFVDDTSVGISWSGAVRNRGTGPMVRIEGFARLHFRGDKICFYSNHVDTAAIAALAQSPPIKITSPRRP